MLSNKFCNIIIYVFNCRGYTERATYKIYVIHMTEEQKKLVIDTVAKVAQNIEDISKIAIYSDFPEKTDINHEELEKILIFLIKEGWITFTDKAKGLNKFPKEATPSKSSTTVVVNRGEDTNHKLKEDGISF